MRSAACSLTALFVVPVLVTGQDLFLAASGKESHAEANLYCTACTELVDKIAVKGCHLVCDAADEPVKEICNWLLEKASCTDIIKKITGGDTPEQACTAMGLCGTECECGVCTKDISDPKTGRCLGLPYDCKKPDATGDFVRMLSAGKKPQSAFATEPRSHQDVSSTHCYGAKCDGTEANYGCCLTCF
jgi:hypothetical protein